MTLYRLHCCYAMLVGGDVWSYSAVFPQTNEPSFALYVKGSRNICTQVCPLNIISTPGGTKIASLELTNWPSYPIMQNNNLCPWLVDLFSWYSICVIGPHCRFIILYNIFSRFSISQFTLLLYRCTFWDWIWQLPEDSNGWK